MSRVWKPVKSAPWRTVVWVRNEMMEKPVKAIRGYADEQGVHPDQSFFTTVYTGDRHFPTPAGRLCCPTEWRELEEGE